VQHQTITSLKNLPLTSTLIIGENGADDALIQQASAIKQFVKNGGRVLCLRQDANHLPNVNKLMNIALKNVTTTLDVPVYPPPPRPSRNGYYVNPERPDHPVFAGIKREQLRVW